MSIEAIITIIITVISLILFATEVLTIDLVALLVMISLIVTGVITPEQGVAGFSNHATLTVAFMFVLSSALLKTGALQYVAHKLSGTFKFNFQLGMVLMMFMIALSSAFVNNTPVVAVFIPVILQIAHSSKQSPKKMLIPLSFASIFGGTCTIVGTSTNMLVFGIAEQNGLAEVPFFGMAIMGVIFVLFGISYMVFFGIKLLPNKKFNVKLEDKFNLRSYITEIKLLPKSNSDNVPLGDSKLVKELDIDVIEIIRKGKSYGLPSDDFILKNNDLLKLVNRRSKT